MEISLTNDWVRAHFLAYNRRITAQKHGHGRGILTGVPLANLVHFSSIDGTVLALTVFGVDKLKLRVLLACKAAGVGQLLASVIERPAEKNHALASIQFLTKVLANHPARNIEVDCLFAHTPHLCITDPVRFILRVGSPFKQPVPVSVASSPRLVMRKQLKLGTVEWTFLGRIVCWWRHNTVDRA